MNKEEIIGKLQMVYVGDRNAFDELVGYYDGLQEVIKLFREENKQLTSQLEYIRSGEYYNQLRFERDMLQDLVDKGEISKEDKEFIDCTHRNVELLEENEFLKSKIEEIKKYIINDLILDFYNDDLPIEILIEKMKKILEKGENNE